MLIACPIFILTLYIPFPAAWITMFLAIFFLFLNTGPSNTALANVSLPAVRATAFAANILCHPRVRRRAGVLAPRIYRRSHEYARGISVCVRNNSALRRGLADWCEISACRHSCSRNCRNQLSDCCKFGRRLDSFISVPRGPSGGVLASRRSSFL